MNGSSHLENHLEVDESTEIAALFDSQVTAATVVARNKYNCRNCGKTGHTKRRCTGATAEVEEEGVGIVPGEYIVGDDPLIICGIGESTHQEVRTNCK